MFGLVLALLIMFFFSHIIQYGITARTGFPARAEEIKSSALRGDLRVRALSIDNPEGFSHEAFLEVDVLRLKVVPSSLLGNRLVVKRLEVEVSSLTGVRTADGRVNFAEFRDAVEGKDGGAGGIGRSVVIEELRVKIDRVWLIDHALDGPDRTREYAVGMDLAFSDVVSLRPIAPEVLRQLAGAGISFDPDGIFASLIPERYLAFYRT